MKNLLDDLGILILRLFAGLTMLIAHGWPKLMAFGDLKDSFPDPFGVGSSLSLGLAIFAEVLCALFLTLGVFTRLSAIPLLSTMTVAFFIVHGGDDFASRELAFMYLGMYLTLLATGGGKLVLIKGKSTLFS